MRITSLSITFFIFFILNQPAFAWGPDGHHLVAAIAYKLLDDSNAKKQVDDILGEISFTDAAVWADCAKGVNPKNGFKYEEKGYLECKVFETNEYKTEMESFVHRNATGCDPKPDEEICHKQYHYTDISIFQPEYSPNLVGARSDDIVAAIAAAVHKLKNEPVPQPFDFKDKREALLVLIHYVGDIHQPLHVGSVYLNGSGERIDPTKATYDPQTETRGGNNLLANTKNLHSIWDGIPPGWTADQSEWITRAKKIPGTDNTLLSWPGTWATQTLAHAKAGFQNVKFGAKSNARWPTTLPNDYQDQIDKIKREEITEAAAHLAELLKAVWP